MICKWQLSVALDRQTETQPYRLGTASHAFGVLRYMPRCDRIKFRLSRHPRVMQEGLLSCSHGSFPSKLYSRAVRPATAKKALVGLRVRLWLRTREDFLPRTSTWRWASEVMFTTYSRSHFTAFHCLRRLRVHSLKLC